LHPERLYLQGFDPASVPSPCYVVDLGALRRNAEILGKVSRESGAKILLALKGFALTAAFDALKPHVVGVCASSPNEAELGKTFFGGEVHTYSPAFSLDSLERCLPFSDHLVLNSPSQVKRFNDRVRSAKVSLGLRVNPQYSEGQVPLYDPCAPGSRLGTPLEQLSAQDLEAVDGLHLHALCEQGADVLERTVQVVEAHFGSALSRLSWLNCGGGHHITQPDYDVQRLIELCCRLKQDYGVQVILEPGEAVAIHTGALVASVLECAHNEMDLAILDCSVTCHMPDVLEMPYRAEILGASKRDHLPFSYRLGGQSCLAGDVLGDYSFSEPLQVGQRLVLEDMSHYTMVKTTTFNGVDLPSIALYEPKTQSVEVVREFGFQDFAHRLG
jgi:carboxynorspermidine decarboxylase